MSDLNRCTVHKLDLKDPARAADDPALAALFRDGWTVISDVPISNPKNPHVILFLAPPAERLARIPRSVIALIGFLFGLFISAGLYAVFV